MARTRGQPRRVKNPRSVAQAKASKPGPKKRARSDSGHNSDSGHDSKDSKDLGAKPSAAKKQKSEPLSSGGDPIKHKADALLSKYGSLPLSDLGLPNPSSSSPENVLALVYNAMLTSARISHELAYKSVKCLIEAEYQDIEALSKSTWQERTEVLTKGGYTRYREKTATGLGELAEFVKNKYSESYYVLFSRLLLHVLCPLQPAATLITCIIRCVYHI